MSTGREQITILDESLWPQLLHEIPDPPKRLSMRGNLPAHTAETKFLCVVGSRKHTSYGADLCTKLITELAGYPIIIISGLALGIDALAHEAALAAGLPTISFPGSGLDDRVLHPKTNYVLAQRIIAAGGCLLSEFAPDTRPADWTFPKRNRLMAGASHATLVIEGDRTSGTMITAKLALDYNRDMLAVPGNVTSITSAGPNQLIRRGATPITCSSDILEALGFERTDLNPEKMVLDLSPTEERIFMQLIAPQSRDHLCRSLTIDVTALNIALATLELKGLIRERLGQVERLV
jgi:DNA processing protein